MPSFIIEYLLSWIELGVLVDYIIGVWHFSQNIY